MDDSGGFLQEIPRILPLDCPVKKRIITLFILPLFIMKQFILPLVALAGLSLPMAAYADSATLGYVNPDVDLTGDNGAQGKDVWSSAAVHIPASTLKTMKGAKITQINAGLQSILHIDGLKVWVRSSLDGENLVETEISKTSTPAVGRGWNNLALEAPFEITDEFTDGLYIGYSVHQTGVAYAISNNFVPVQGAWFVNIDEAGWTDNSDRGSLCLTAVVEGENLPATNLSIVDFQAPEMLVIDRKQAKGAMTVKNYGTEAVKSFDISMIIDGDKAGVTQRTIDIPAGQVARFEFVVEPNISEEGDYKVEYILDNIDTGEDADMTDNREEAMLQVIPEPLRRNVLVEEFTTEMCGNCPSAASTISNILHKDLYKDNMIVICYHAGYYTDWLTTKFAEDYTWFYNTTQTFAPAMMVDRATISDTPVSMVTSYGLEGKLNERLDTEPLVRVNIKTSYDESNHNLLNVNVSGVKYAEKLCDNPVITVWVTEDNIPARYQSGGGTKFVHQHVGRAVNATWGEDLAFNEDNTYSYSVQFLLDPSWKKEDLNVVAAVHNGGNSPSTYEVMNAAISHSDEFTTVDSIAADDNADAEYFTISGMRVSSDNLEPGIYLRKTADKTEKVVIR